VLATVLVPSRFHVQAAVTWRDQHTEGSETYNTVTPDPVRPPGE
jgi:hypothetical protein